MMHPSYRSKYLALDAELISLFEELSKYSFEVLDKKPKPGAWSVLEVLQHLLVVEKKSLAYAKKKSSYPESLKNANFNDHFRQFLLYLYLRAPLKIKAPALVNEEQFVQGVTFEELMEDWQQARQELMAFLDSVPQEWAGKLIFRTFAGRMTLGGMLFFFKEHFARHKKQIKRTLKATR